MVIQLSKRAEALLQRAAEDTGRPAEELAADAITAMFGDRSQPRRGFAPRLVEIIGDESPEERYGPQPNGQPWPESVGMISDGRVDAEAFEDWLAVEYEKDWLEAERQSTR